MTYGEALNAIDIRAYEDNIEIRRWRLNAADGMAVGEFAHAAHYYSLLKALPHARIDPKITALLMLEGELL